ncbi:MAG: hypothetical protein ACR2PG_10800 [Hyphomicrobiaceae bacterium]
MVEITHELIDDVIFETLESMETRLASFEEQLAIHSEKFVSVKAQVTTLFAAYTLAIEPEDVSDDEAPAEDGAEEPRSDANITDGDDGDRTCADKKVLDNVAA